LPPPSLTPLQLALRKPAGLDEHVHTEGKQARRRLTKNCANYPLQAPLPRRLPEDYLGKASNLV
jgi:hypothetical protein